MVCVRIVGGGLIEQQLQKAAQHHANNETAAAVAIYRNILNQTPTNPDALLMMGVIAQQAGNPHLALQFVESSLASKPDFAQAWFNRSIILRALKRDEDALMSARMAIDAAPHMAEAWDIVAQILKDSGTYAEALTAYKHALALQPKNSHFYGNYATLLLAMHDFQGAYQAVQEALAIDAHYSPIVLGNILKAMGYPEQAADYFARARVHPTYAEAIISEALARLQIGDTKTGWNLWEQRADLAPELGSIPFWHGEEIDRLFLYEDQGLGDAIQFVRYIPSLKKKASHITLCVHPSLQNVFAQNFPYIDVINSHDAVPPVTARCRLSSLPFFFKTDLATIPPTPYLKIENNSGLANLNELETTPSPRVGIVWAGNKKFRNDNARSISFSALDSLFTLGRAHFVSLQKDCAEDSIALAASSIFDAAPLINNFTDTAALIAKLDLIITVDTAVAHLAGALQKPVFILLPFDSDWRWLLGREDSPWYSSARLFRQKSPGDWTSVIQAVRKEVEKFLAGNRAALLPSQWNSEPLRKNPNALPLPASRNS